MTTERGPSGVIYQLARGLSWLRVWSMLWVAFWIVMANAQEPAPPSTDPSVVVLPNRGEYQRLSQELEKLSSRNAWAGVERTYVALLETGVTPSFEDYIAGAHSARALGDVAGSRARLIAANAVKEDRNVVDWLWDIDSHYSRVLLACDIGRVTLDAVEMPFDPNQRKAVEYAQALIVEKGMFDGYLPQGRYLFGKETEPGGAQKDRELVVEPQVQSLAFDIRTEEGIRTAERLAKKAAKKAEKEAKQLE